MKRTLPRSILLLAPVLSAASAAPAGETMTVTTLDDVVDFGGAQQVGDLPGPDGRVSFREAVIAANNTAGPQEIHFAIPESEWWLYDDRALLRLEDGAFVLTDAGTTVDFTTQTAATGDTNPGGSEVGIYGLEPNGAGSAAIYLNGTDCVIRGLGVVLQRGYAVRIQGDANRVVGCTISGPLFAAVYVNGVFNGDPAEANVIGGTQPGDPNTLSAGNSGVRIDGPARDNVVVGNTLSGSFYGAEVRTPTCCPGNDAVDNRIGGPTEAERNVIAGAGKYGEEGFPVGGQVTVQYSTGTIVEGNYVGVNADGMTVPAIQRGPVGVEVRSSPDTTVRDNLIGGILVVGINHHQGERFGNAIHVMGDCTGSVIEGNQIGIGADGALPIPSRAGIVASHWSVDGGPVQSGHVSIGGPAPGQANRIAHSETEGIRVDPNVEEVRISANSIHSNGGLGIDLLQFGVGTGVTPNDPEDTDEGGNRLQNFPVILAAQSCGAMTVVAGTLNSTPGEAFRLEFFANGACDPSGFGEGRTFLGATTVVTDRRGDASFQVALPHPTTPGTPITATATDAAGNTSEFSACQESGACPRRPLSRDPRGTSAP